jgi:hypothetical protein
MKRTLSLFFLVLVLGRVDAAAQVVAIRAGRLAVPETGATLSNQDLLFAGRDQGRMVDVADRCVR